MKTLSLKLRIPSPRAWFAIAAFFISPLLWAGFSLPTAPVPYTTYSIAWFGSYTLNPGAVLYLQVQAPGETTWRTIGSGTSTYYGAIYVYSRYAFDAEGVWSIRTTNGASTTLLVSNSPCQVPSYEPTFWNDGGTIQYNNNCYNYANNKRTDTFAQPGRGGGQMYDPDNITCPEIHAAAIRDGLIPTDSVSAVPSGFMKIALVVAPGYDFHWYRLGCNGYWTHKPGGTQATNLDNSGNLITNPETANRGPYSDFCGYFLTPTGVPEGSGQATIY